MKMYENSQASISDRVADLLNEMTLFEKIAQANITRGVFFFEKSSESDGCDVSEDDILLEDKMSSVFGDRGIGYVHDIYTVPAQINLIQKYMVEKTRLGIPCIFTSEALHGAINKDCSILPVPLNLGATFNTELAKQFGNVISEEVRAFGFQEVLAPNLDVAREQRWGRVEETFGENTYLSSQMAAAEIEGLQRGGIGKPNAVIAEPKHYCAHGLPEGGLNCANARVGRREIETEYLPVFKAAINAGAYNVMACFNSIDGEPILSSKYYLKDVLKDKLKLKGISRADWGAVNRLRHPQRIAVSEKDAVRIALSAGLDMQGCCDVDSVNYEKYIAELIESGQLCEEALNETVKRILTMKFELGLFENPYTDEEGYKQIMRCEKHKDIMKRIAKESMVLLKNDGLLPLDKKLKSIAVIGPSSAKQQLGGYSGKALNYRVKSVYDELIDKLPKDIIIRQCDGCGVTDSDGGVLKVDGQPHLTQVLESENLDTMETAIKIASGSDVVIFVGGDNTITSGEGFDRCGLKLFGKQRELLRKISELKKPTVLVLESGRSVDIYEESKTVDAILCGGFGGEFGAEAICDTLLGNYNPAGRLNVSYPINSQMSPIYLSMLPGGANQYLEGERKALYCFGHGLSYTRFKYSKLSVEKCEKYDYKVLFELTNCGDRNGEEVAQLYICDKVSSVVTPEKSLRGFKRVSIPVGVTEKVEFRLDFSSFMLCNADYEWVVEDGEFEIMIGSSSDDIRLLTTIKIN